MTTVRFVTLAPAAIWPVEATVTTDALVIVPDKGLASFSAVTAPLSVPMLMFVMVPWPAAVMAPAATPTDMPEMAPVDTVPVGVMVSIVVLVIVPEPGFASSGAVNDPDSVPMLTPLVVPWPAGSSFDVVGRVVAEGIRRKYGNTVIVDNRVGASGNLGQAFVARSKPDGYTFIVTTRGPQPTTC